MLPKYYTPTSGEAREEFLIQTYDLTNGWCENPMDSYDVRYFLEDFYSFNEREFSKKYRVRYLDLEDIKKFGFNFLEAEVLDDEEDGSIDFTYSLDKFKDYKYILILTLSEYNLEKTPHIIIFKVDKDSGKSNSIFIGDVKNRSELEVILNQLGVIKE